jgi:hypothetical protein
VDRLFDSLSAPDDEQVAGSTDDATLEGSTR